jgi:hypothetical protein
VNHLNMAHRNVSGISQTSQSSIPESLASLARASLAYLNGAMEFTDALLGPSSTVTSKLLLQRMLSTRSTISTASSFALENQYSQVDHQDAQFVLIGQGQCGRVWNLRGTEMTFKIPLDISHLNRLMNDRLCHRLAVDAFQAAPMDLKRFITIPALRGWLVPTDAIWEGFSSRLPFDYSYERFALMSQYIMPIPEPCREALVDIFCPKHLRKNIPQILANQQNKNCLIRIYLGRRDPKSRASISQLKLYNFPMLVNDMEELGMNTQRLAGVMADALAILHWTAHLDANDVEFVFGSSPARDTSTFNANDIRNASPWTSEQGLADFQRRFVHMWLLDFNECHEFEENPEGLKLICNGFWFNDPYYPRPGSDNVDDIELWAIFRDRYLQSSGLLTTSSMPGRFIAAVEAEGARRSKAASAAGAGSIFEQMMR